MATKFERVEKAFEKMPLVAILRGLTPERAVEVGEIVVKAGFTALEVPLNSPEPFESIRLLREALPAEVVVGCGTLVNIEDVPRLVETGAEIMVTPTINPAIISAAVEAGLVPMPGFLTPTEAFAAAQAGAKYLKLFPANAYPIGYAKGLMSVLPKDVKLLAVGGVDDSNGAEYFAAGFAGLGLGSCLFKPTMSNEEIADAAARMVAVAIAR